MRMRNFKLIILGLLSIIFVFISCNGDEPSSSLNLNPCGEPEDLLGSWRYVRWQHAGEERPIEYYYVYPTSDNAYKSFSSNCDFSYIERESGQTVFSELGFFEIENLDIVITITEQDGLVLDDPITEMGMITFMESDTLNFYRYLVYSGPDTSHVVDEFWFVKE